MAFDVAESKRLRAEVDQVFETLRAAVGGATPDLVHASTPTAEDRVLHQFAPILDVKVPARPDEETRKYLPYWYSTQNSRGKAIAAAGFRASRVRLDTETVDFVRR